MLRGNVLGDRLPRRHRLTSLAMAASCFSHRKARGKNTNNSQRRRSGLTLTCVLFLLGNNGRILTLLLLRWRYHGLAGWLAGRRNGS